MKRVWTLFGALALVVGLTACGLQAPERQSIAATAAELGDFDTLLDLLTDEGLAGLFADDEAGPFTVFAPTDAAFEALAEAGVTSSETLDLTAVLLYHVLEGRFSPPELIAAGSAGTLLAEGVALPLCFAADGPGWVVNETSSVIAGPVQATNGVIYAIDEVLDFGYVLSSVAGVAADEAFVTLVQAVIEAGLLNALVCGGPFTVFAPTDEAFGDLLEALEVTAEELLENTELLVEVLLYHVVAGELFEADVAAALTAGDGSVTLTTLQGSTIEVTLEDEGIFINGGSQIIGTDVEARNGVIHVIDAVLLP